MESERRDFRPPARVNDLPAGTRLAFLVYDITSIAARASREQGLRRGNETMLRDALNYTPPLVKSVAEGLGQTRILLLEHGQVQDDPSQHRTENDAVLETEIGKRLGPDLSRPTVLGDRGKTTQRMVNKVLQAIHPDKTDAFINEVLPSEEAAESYKETLRASRQNNPELAQEILLEILPKIYLQRIVSMLSSGMTLDEVVERNPAMVAELEELRWIAAVRLPRDGVYRPAGRPELIRREAEKIRKEKNLYAPSTASYLTFTTLGEIMGLVGKAILPLDMVRGVGYMQGQMERVTNIFGIGAELVFREGNWIMPPHAEAFRKEAERLLVKLPADLFGIVATVFSDDSTEDAAGKAVAAAGYTTASIAREAERYKQAIDASMEQRSRVTIGKINSASRENESLNNSFETKEIYSKIYPKNRY